MAPPHHDIHEQTARERSRDLEAAGKLPAGFTKHHYPLTRSERLELQRLATAWRLAPDVRTLEDLLLGVPIDQARLNTDALEQAREASLVQLVAPLDTLTAA